MSKTYIRRIKLVLRIEGIEKLQVPGRKLLCLLHCLLPPVVQEVLPHECSTADTFLGCNVSIPSMLFVHVGGVFIRDAVQAL